MDFLSRGSRYPKGFRRHHRKAPILFDGAPTSRSRVALSMTTIVGSDTKTGLAKSPPPQEGLDEGK